jgi:hypothetical protein
MKELNQIITLKTMTKKEHYNKLLKSGMFFEFYPELTGDWKTDKDKFKIKTNANTNTKRS